MRKPDWDTWIAADRLEAWQAVCLSLNIEPDSVVFDGSTVRPLPSADITNQFNKRTRILNSLAYAELNIIAMPTAFSGLLRAKISLNEFSGWAMTKQWDIPEKLLNLVNASVAGEDSTRKKTSSERIMPSGGDSLTSLIWDICYDLEKSQKRVKPKDVMQKLKFLAQTIPKRHPLVGEVSGGVKYETEMGDEKELTSEQLRKRIDGWKDKTGR